MVGDPFNGSSISSDTISECEFELIQPQKLAHKGGLPSTYILYLDRESRDENTDRVFQEIWLMKILEKNCEI